MGMFKRNILSSAASFQGVGGVNANKPAADGDDTDDMNKPAGESDEKDMPKDKKEAKGKAKAKPDDGENNDEDEDDDEEGDDDTDEDELRKKGTKAASARRRERARISTILSHPAAAEKQDFALDLALNTDYGRAAACRLLDKAPSAGSASTLNRRMESQQNRHIGAGGPAADPQAKIDGGWDAVLKSRNIPLK